MMPLIPKRIHLLYFLFISIQSQSSIVDYIFQYRGPSISNYGTTGLIQNPNARFFEEGTLSLSWTHNEPYLRGSLIANPFSWLEASYQYVDINNFLYSQSSDFSGSQSLKDKSFDIKMRIFKERKYFPQVAIGLRDFGGTGVFSSEYIALNKFLNPIIDLTLGMGWGKMNANSIGTNPFKFISDRFELRSDDPGLGGKPKIDDFFSGDAGYFFGLEISVPKKNGMRLKFELDSTNYLTEGKLPLPQKSNYNFGIYYPVNDDISLKASIVRGSQLTFGFSYSLGLGSKNPRKIKKTKPVALENASVIRQVTRKSSDNLYKASLLYLSEENISLKGSELTENQLNVTISQSKYRSPSLAIGRTANILDQISPESIDKFKISEINGGIGIYSAEISRDNFRRAKEFKSPELLKDSLKVSSFSSNDSKFSPRINYPASFISFYPDLQSQIGGPDGFFFGDLKLSMQSELLFSSSFSVNTILSYGLIDNLDSLKLASDSVLPHVRTDIVSYMKNTRQSLSIQRLQFNKFGKLHPSLFYKLSGGIMEGMFNALGGEILFRPFDKNFGIGIEAWQVYQRGYDQTFKHLGYKTLTGHMTLYYHEPLSNILFQLKGGRYLAKDSGFTFDFQRVFRSGTRIGAFFSLTDISSEEFGEGSFDKGIYFYVPIDLFTSEYSRRVFPWGIRPLTRDGAQSLIHSYPLWGVTDLASKMSFHRSLNDIFD